MTSVLEFSEQKSTSFLFSVPSKWKCFDHFEPFTWTTLKLSLNYLKNFLENTSKYSQLKSFSDDRKCCWQPEWSANFRPLCDKTLFRQEIQNSKGLKTYQKDTSQWNQNWKTFLCKLQLGQRYSIQFHYMYMVYCHAIALTWLWIRPISPLIFYSYIA